MEAMQDGCHFSVCILEIKLGNSGCYTTNPTLNSCEDQYALCDKNFKCVCKPGYYDDNGAETRLGTCRQSKLAKTFNFISRLLMVGCRRGVKLSVLPPFITLIKMTPTISDLKS